MIHVLHISKTGGTAIKAALREHPDQFKLYHHSVRLSDCPVGEKVFFVVRNPLDRFVSSFNSRLRQGAPRYLWKWSHAEAKAFRYFSNPTDLAEALSSFNILRRYRARTAMLNVRHVKASLVYWLGSMEYLNSRRADVLVGHTATLDADFSRLLKLCSIETVHLPADPIVRHKTPEHMDRHLSEAARINLSKWYAKDIALYHTAIRLQQGESHA